MSQFDDFMGQAFGAAGDVFGRELVSFEGLPEPVEVDWNGGNAREELIAQGVTFNVVATIVVARADLGSTPPRLGQKVVRDGVTYVISGTLAEDSTAYTLALDSLDIAQD